MDEVENKYHLAYKHHKYCGTNEKFDKLGCKNIQKYY